MEKRRYKFGGLGACESWCDLEVDQKLHIVIVYEVKDNPGTSVTNAAEILANQVCKDFNLDVNKVIWIEENKGYALVDFMKYGGKLRGPKWTYIDEKQLQEILN